jgi:hypothetical protein
LMALAMLFLLSLLTGMLMPPSWILNH